MRSFRRRRCCSRSSRACTVCPASRCQYWFDYVDGKIRVNTARGRVKARILHEGSPVALAIMDPDNPYRYIQIRGRIVRVQEGADAHIDSLAKKYLGQDKYPYRQPGEVRIMYEIEPTSVQAMAA